MKLAKVVEMLSNPEDSDDFGRDMVKVRCMVDEIIRVIYVQHPVDNRLIAVGYIFEVYK